METQLSEATAKIAILESGGVGCSLALVDLFWPSWWSWSCRHPSGCCLSSFQSIRSLVLWWWDFPPHENWKYSLLSFLLVCRNSLISWFKLHPWPSSRLRTQRVPGIDGLMTITWPIKALPEPDFGPLHGFMGTTHEYRAPQGYWCNRNWPPHLFTKMHISSSSFNKSSFYLLWVWACPHITHTQETKMSGFSSQNNNITTHRNRTNLPSLRRGGEADQRKGDSPWLPHTDTRNSLSVLYFVNLAGSAAR